MSNAMYLRCKHGGLHRLPLPLHPLPRRFPLHPWHLLPRLPVHLYLHLLPLHHLSLHHPLLPLLLLRFVLMLVPHSCSSLIRLLYPSAPSKCRFVSLSRMSTNHMPWVSLSVSYSCRHCLLSLNGSSTHPFIRAFIRSFIARYSVSVRHPERLVECLLCIPLFTSLSSLFVCLFAFFCFSCYRKVVRYYCRMRHSR